MTLVPVKTAAVLTGHTTKEVRRLIRTKRIRLYACGKHLFVDLDAVPDKK